MINAHHQSLPHAQLPALIRLRQGALLIGVAGLALCAVGGLLSPQQFFRSYLFGYVFWLGVPLGCLAIALLHNLSGGAWGVVIRRLLESGTRTLPVMALLFLPLVFGLHHLYAWARPEVVAADPLLQHKSVYLNTPFFLLRTALYFSAWLVVAFFLNKCSLAQDNTADPQVTQRLRLLGGPGLVLYGLGVTFASIDWVMSLDAHWFSTMYGALFMIGYGLTSLAFVIVAAAWLSSNAVRARPLADVLAPEHFHDLGQLLLAFVMLWAYLSFSQYLIIWSGNIQEETPWYLHRLRGGWQGVALALVLFHFVVPFFLLLSRDLKRNARLLAWVAGVIVFMRLVDLFWLMAPSFYPTGLRIHWLDCVAPLSLGGLWLATFIWQLQRRPLLPLYDPSAEELLHRE